jgi:hypothetical protein
MKKLYTFLVLALLAPNFSFAQVPCDQPTGSPGFPEIPACEAAVCEYDEFCCNGSWDSMCAIYSGMFEPCYPCVLGSNKSYLTGQIFFDVNCNGIFDAGEYVIPNHPVLTSPSALTNITDANFGFYNAILNNGVNYTVSAWPINGFTISNSENIQVPEVTTIIENENFGLCPIPGYFDGAVSFSPNNFAWIIGTANDLTFQVLNNSGWNISGQVTLTYNVSAFQIISTSGSVNGNQITWEVEDIEPLSTVIISTTFSAIFSGNHNFSLSFTMDEETGEEAFLGNNIANMNAFAYGEFGSDFCDAPQSTPGFPSFPDCEQAVCAADTFCCENSWDAVCAASATQFPECAFCLSVLSGSSFAMGSVFFDADCNEILDDEESSIPGILVSTNGIVSGYSNSSGLYYSVLQNYSTQTLTVSSLPGFSSNSITINTDSSQTYSEMNIGYCPVSPVSNVGVSISPSGPPPRPGFPMNYIVCISNLGSIAASSDIEFDFSEMANCTVLQPGDGTVNGTLIEFNAIELDIFETLCFTIVMQVPVGTPAGTLLNPTVIANLQPNPLDDVDLSNNIHTLHQEVVAAYDPNDKTVDFPVVNHTEIPAGEGAQLEYLIRFQNTGNFYATFVKVVDELPELLDISTIHMINASHNYELSFPEPNVLEWFFDEIMLPDSTTDEPGSHGFIHFRIKTVAGVELDDVIENNASIYFDFKAPIITEYAVTTFMDCTEGSLEILGAQTVCPGTEVVLSSSRNDFSNYSWSFGDQQQEGSSISFVLNENTSVELLATHPVCQLSANVELQVFDVPEVEITAGGALLTATQGASYQWFFNDEPIANSNSQSIVALENGVYSVVVTFESGCEATGELEFLSVGINDSQSDQIVMMPNPAKDFVRLQLPDGHWEITLYDIAGKVYKVMNVANTNGIEIPLNDLATGIYLVKAQSEGSLTVKKLVKQ